MEIKKKGKKWVAVDEYGIEYTHKHIEFDDGYAKPLGKKGDRIRYLCIGSYGMVCAFAYTATFEKFFKPIEPPAPFWHKYEVDTPVLVRNTGSKDWYKYYFAGMSVGGLPCTFSMGATSWSNNSLSKPSWDQIKDVETGEVWKVN